MNWNNRGAKATMLYTRGVPAQANTRNLYLGLAIGVVAVSFAAIFIRLAEAPSLVIASYRLTIAAAIMIGLTAGSWIRNGVQSVSGLTKRDMPLVLLSSASLSVHFWAWILSLEYTSVASSVVLVTTSPFLVAIASRAFFGEPIHKYAFAGIAVGVAGGVILALGDAGGESEVLGDLLAFIGAVAIVGYMLAGRRLRRHVPALSYNSAVYSGTAVILLIAAIMAGDPFTGYTPQTYLWLVMMALVPQVIGHSLLNWSLAHVTATAVAIAVMAEPVIATAAAVIVLGETPPLTSVLGGLLILSGIYVAMRYGHSRS